MELHALFTLLLTQAHDAGRTAPDLDSDQEAGTLLALLDGLATLTLLGHHTTASALRIVHAHVDRLFRPA